MTTPLETKTYYFETHYARDHKLDQAQVDRATQDCFHAIDQYAYLLEQEARITAHPEQDHDGLIKKNIDDDKKTCIDRFRALVTATPRLVDFDAVIGITGGYIPEEGSSTIRHAAARSDFNLIHYACAQPYDMTPFLEILVNEGKQPVDKWAARLSPVHNLSNPSMPNMDNPHAQMEGTPLTVAIIYGNYAAAKWLLEHGATASGQLPEMDVEIANLLRYPVKTYEESDSPSLAAAIQYQPDDLRYAKLLLTHHVQPSLFMLHHALTEKNFAVADLFLDHGVSLASDTPHAGASEADAEQIPGFAYHMATSGQIEAEAMMWAVKRGAYLDDITIDINKFLGPSKLAQSPEQIKIEACVAIYNESLNKAKATWTEWHAKAEAFVKGDKSWNPESTTLEQLMQFANIGKLSEAMDARYWNGHEAFADRLLQKVPGYLQASCLHQIEYFRQIAEAAGTQVTEADAAGRLATTDRDKGKP